MDVVWGIVTTLVYIVAVFIAVEFCCGRIKKYSTKREEEEEASGRRESAAALTPDDVPVAGATAAAETTAEDEVVVEKASSDEERIRTDTADADDALEEVSPEPEVTIDIHKEPPMPAVATPDIIPEPENIPEPVNIPDDVHVKKQAQEEDQETETLETVPKEPEVQQVVEVEEVEPKKWRDEPAVVEIEPEVEQVEPEVEQVEPEVEQVELEEEQVEPEEEEEGDAAVAATKIQAGFRGHQSRKRVKKLKEEKDAATKIQAGFRGWKTRKQVSVKKRDEPLACIYPFETEGPPAAVTEEDSSLSMPSDVTEHHVAKETVASGTEPPETFADEKSPVEEATPEVPSPAVEPPLPTELFAKQPDITPPTASPEVTQPKIAEMPSPTEAESPETSSPEEISPAPFSKPIPPTPPPTPADVDLFAGGTEATEPVLGKEPILEGEIVVGEVEPAMVKAVAEKLDVLEKETVEASEKVLYQPGTEVSFVVPPPLQPEPMATVAKEEIDSSPEPIEQPTVKVVETKTLTKLESEVYPYVEETHTSEEFDPESLIAQAVSSKSTPEVVVTSERTVTMETGPEGKTQTVVKVEHTVVKEVTTVVTPKTSEVVTTEERTATSVSSDERSSEEQVTVVEASDDDTFEESGLEQQLHERSSGPKDKGAQLDRNSASFTDKWEPAPGEKS